MRQSDSIGMSCGRTTAALRGGRTIAHSLLLPTSALERAELQLVGSGVSLWHSPTQRRDAMKRFPLITAIVLCFTANLPATPAMSLVDRRQTATALDTVILSDTSRKTQTNRPVSISRIFRSGEISQFAQAVVDRGVGPVLTQCDVKSRWPNGSLKHAIVSFTLPAIAPGKPVTVSFQNQASGNNNNPLSPAKMLAPNFNFDAQIRLTGRASAIISA